MKKSLLAVAAMTAFAGAAHAQSSVTIYGVLDESYSSLKQTDRASLNKTTQGLKDSAWTSNRLGFQGSEDLGGGSSTVFTVESGLAVANAGPEAAGLGNTFPSIRLHRIAATLHHREVFWSGQTG